MKWSFRVKNPDAAVLDPAHEAGLRELGLAFEYIDEKMLAPTQAWIDTGERPQMAGTTR